MNIRIVRVDLSDTNKQLERIADLLEGILGATDPANSYFDRLPVEDDVERVLYTNERDEIIAAAVDRLKRHR
jgi:hypothetical protein